MNLDYLNLNSLRNYPIQDGCSRVSDDNLFTIPNSLIVDMSLCSSQLGSNPTMYISTITCNSGSVLVEVSANSSQVFGTFQINLPLADYNQNVTMVPNPSFPSATGWITFGSSADLANQPYGTFTFSPTNENTTLLMRVFGPVVYGLSWINFTDTTGNTTSLTGAINLIGNSNIQFRASSNNIYIDAGEGLGLNKTCATIPQPILSINGIAPDDSGNFTLIGNTCVSIDDAQYGVAISNTCGEPCLGCAAIDTLTTQVNSLENTVLAIQAFTQNLQAVITQATNLMSIPCQCN